VQESPGFSRGERKIKYNKTPGEARITLVNHLLDHACAKGLRDAKRLKAEKYCELKMKYPSLPSLYTACRMACSIYKGFRKLKRGD
jgi:hypothetical protein